MLVRRMWTAKGMRPTVTITGSHQKTCVFGTISTDGRQLFRQYDYFDGDTFLLYLKEIKRKFHKFIIFLDRAAQHYRSKKVKAFMENNKNAFTVLWIPKGSPEFNAIEECWRQGKDDLLVSRYYPKFHDLKTTISDYYRTKRFRFDITKYLLRSIT